METLLDQDTALFLFLNGLGNSAWDNFWLISTHKLTWIPLYLLFVFFVYKIERTLWKTLLIVALLGLLVGFNDSLSNICKHYFERPRPCQVEAILQSPTFRMVAPYCGKYGYFSAHAANHFAIATFLALYFRNFWRVAPLFLFSWAAMVAYSRIYVGVHYPLDVLTGMLVGVLSGLCAYQVLFPFVFRRLMRQKKK